ncbi:MAG: RHS repeat-associated core domain-containing protein [Luteimonas sp.]
MKSDTSGLWISEQDALRDTLAELTLASGNPGYLLTLSNGSRETYDATGMHLETQEISGDTLFYEYDSNRRLQKVRNQSGRFLEFVYNSSKRLERVTSSSGQTVNYTYNANRILESANYGGYLEKYLYTSFSSVHSYLVRVEDGGGNEISSYTYDVYSQGRPTSTQRAGGVNRYTVDHETGWLSKVFSVTPLNASVAYSYRTLLGRRVIDRVETTCAGCATDAKIYAYDNNLNIIQVEDGNSKICRAYEQTRNLEATSIEGASATFDCATMAGGSFQKKTTTLWHPSFRLPLQRDVRDSTGVAKGRVTWTYNARGQALSQTQTDPVTSTTRATTTSYCEETDITAGTCPLLGLVTSVNGPRTDVTDLTTYTYYPSDDAACATSPTTCPHRKGDLWKVTNSLGHVTETLQYDGVGRVLSVKDANGVITDMEYHPRGWLTARKVRGVDSAVESDDQITRIEYWPTGLVKKVTQPDNAFTSYTYDAAHRLTDISDNADNTMHYTLDNAGNKTQEDTKDVQGTLRRTLSRVYNQLGQLQTQKDALQQPTGFTYDANGNTDTVADALTRVIDNDYDPLNRLSRTLQDVGGINAQTSFQYDALDNLTQVTDPKGLNTGYSYNGLGDLLQLSSPDTGATTYTYDSGGNRKTQVDARSKTATYSYDVLNRLTSIAYPVTSLNVTYTYDVSQTVCTSGETFSNGRLTKLQDASGTTQYCFDRFGNLVRKVQTTNAKVFTLRYAYTPGGRLQRLTYPNGASVDYVRNTQGQVSDVGITPAGGTRQVLLSQATYAPFGPATGWTYGNGRTLQRTLNQNYQPNVISDAAPGGLSLGYAFDPVGNLATLRTGQQTDPPLATYGYDALNRLSDVRDGPTGTVIEHYAYDATGNRQSVTNAGATTAYTYPGTSHRLTKVGTTTRSYDAAGNTTQIGGTARQFIYDDANRMSQVKAGTKVKMNYVTNGKGEQVRKYLGTTNTYTVYDEAGHWLGDYDTAGAPLQQAIWLDDLPVGVLVGAGTAQKLHYLEPDALGTPRVVIDPVRNVAVWKWELKGEAFGNTVPNQNPDNDANQFVFNMRFSGQRYDAASGLNYNYFRDYEAATGRYVESDPVGLGGGPNTYAYANGMPTGAYDSKGLAAVRLPPYGPGQQLPYGTIYCDDGVVAPFVNWNRWPSYDQKCIGDCILAHEQSHARDATRSNPGVCRYWGWVPFIHPRGIVGFNRPERLASEFGAYAVELRCLAAKLAREKCTSDMCQKVIEGRINDIVNVILPTVYNGTYPNGLPGSE